MAGFLMRHSVDSAFCRLFCRLLGGKSGRPMLRGSSIQARVCVGDALGKPSGWKLGCTTTFCKVGWLALTMDQHNDIIVLL